MNFRSSLSQGFRKWVFCVCCHLFIFYFSELSTFGWNSWLTLGSSLDLVQHMVWLRHVHCITALTVVCAGSCREFSPSFSFSLSRSHTHAHVPHAYGRHQPTVHPKAPWEICKLADAQRCPSCSPGLISLTRRVSLRTRAFVRGSFMNIYDF